MKAKVTLPNSHRRSLSVTARFVEAGLNEMEDLLLSNGRERLTEKITPSFSPEDREEMIAAISRMREANAAMFKTLDLQPDTRTEAQLIMGKVTHLWTILVDSKSKALRGFGQLPPDIAEAVDTEVDNLLELLEEIRSWSRQG